MQGYGAGARILEELKPEPPELVIEWSRSHNKGVAAGAGTGPNTPEILYISTLNIYIIQFMVLFSYMKNKVIMY